VKIGFLNGNRLPFCSEEEERLLFGIGEAEVRKNAEKLAAIDACLQLVNLGLLRVKSAQKTSDN